MTAESQNAYLDVGFTFTRRPRPVPPELRPLWRVAVVLLILEKCCRGATSSFRKLHVLNWAIRTPTIRDRFRRLLSGDIGPGSVAVRFDPALNRATDFAIGEGLIERLPGARFRLTPAGRVLARELDAATDLLARERAFLDELGKSVTEDFVKRLFLDGRPR